MQEGQTGAWAATVHALVDEVKSEVWVKHHEDLQVYSCLCSSAFFFPP